MPVNSLHKLRF